MANHLTKKHIETIVSLIEGWDGKLTWNLLSDKCFRTIGFSPTRQTLSSHPAISNAFKAAKQTGANSLKSTKTTQSKPQSLAIAAHRIDRLEREVTRLKQENNLLLEQFIVWQQNTTAKGLNLDDLNLPLIKIDRERTQD